MTEVDGVLYKLTQSQVQTITNVFEVYSKQKSSSGTSSSNAATLRVSQIGSVFRSLNQNPTESLIGQLVQYLKNLVLKENEELAVKADTDNLLNSQDPEFKLSHLLRLCEQNWFTSETVKLEMLIDAFKQFDPDGEGFISISLFRYILLGMGETLNNNEADKFIEWALTLPGAENSKDKTLNYDIITQELIERNIYVA